MNKDELELAHWSIETQLKSILNAALRSQEVCSMWERIEPSFEGLDLETINEYFILGDSLETVWHKHPSGFIRHGELTPNKLKKILDENDLYHEDSLRNNSEKQ